MNGFLTKHGRPTLFMGLQTQNSSTGDAELLAREIDAVQQIGGNLLEAPVYWYSVEPEKDRFQFDSVQNLIDLCRKAKLSLIFLWFATNKNGHPNYAPEYIKTEPEAYHVAQSRNGAHVASLSPHCAATLTRDRNAFCKLMGFLAEYDRHEQTVVLVQVENETGLANTDRDYSPEAQAQYEVGVPECLMSVQLEDMGIVPSGTGWKSRFGRHAHEAFSAYYHALYVQQIAKAGKAVYALPMMLNVMIGEQGYEEAGASYSGGAAVGRVLDIYKIVAPDIDLICPDMYIPERERYLRVCDRYTREDNALFIPESPSLGLANALNMMEAFARFGCIGMCYFGANYMLDSQGNFLPDALELVYSMRAVVGVAPLLVKYRGTGKVHALVQQEFMEKLYLRLAHYHVEAKFISACSERYGLGCRINPQDPANGDILTTRGRALLIQTGEHEFFLSGAGVKVDFIQRPNPEEEDSYAHLTSRQSGTLNFLSVEEGHFDGEDWVVDRYRNGDESNFELFVHRGQTVRIRLNPKR